MSYRPVPLEFFGLDDAVADGQHHLEPIKRQPVLSEIHLPLQYRRQVHDREQCGNHGHLIQSSVLDQNLNRLTAGQGIQSEARALEFRLQFARRREPPRQCRFLPDER